MPGTGRRIEYEHDEVDLAERLDGSVDHPHVQAVERTMDTRRVDEHDLPVLVVS